MAISDGSMPESCGKNECEVDAHWDPTYRRAIEAEYREQQLIRRVTELEELLQRTKEKVTTIANRLRAEPSSLPKNCS